MKLNKELMSRVVSALWLLLFLAGTAEIASLGIAYQRRTILERSEVLKEDFRQAVSILRERLEKFRFGLQGVAGLYHVEKFHPSPIQVRTYAASRDFYRNFTGVFGFGYIRVVPTSELKSYEASRARLDPGFKVHGFFPAPDKRIAASYVIESIEPKERNLPALGLDVSSEINRYEAANHAAETGLTTLTRRISLVQKETAGAGFLLFHPVYQVSPIPPTAEERRRLFVGWVYAPVLMSSLFESVAATESSRLFLRISELEGSHRAELFTGKGWKASGDPAPYSQVINAFEKPWIIEGRPAQPLWRSGETGFLCGLCFLATLFYGAMLYSANRFVHFWSRAEKKARQLEVWQRAIFDDADFAILTIDPDGIILALNAGAVRMLGYGADEVVGRAGLSIFHEDQEVLDHARKAAAESGAEVRPDFDTFVQRTKDGGVHRGEWTYVRRDGTRFPGQLNMKAIADDAGEHIGFVAIIQDLTEKRGAEARMVQSAQLASLGEMSGGIAHEINNPLAMIKGKASVLLLHLEKGAPDVAKLKADLEKINGVVDRIAAIVAGLRAFSRDASQEALKEASLGRVLTETASLCRERFKAHGVELRLYSDDNLYAACRPLQVSQALLNLLNNAHDAVVDLPSPWVEIRLKVVGTAARFEVTDAGRGIPEEVAAKMMRPFYTTKEVGKGTGLGLSISKGLIEAQGGKFYYEPDSLHTLFVVEIPGVVVKPAERAA